MIDIVKNNGNTIAKLVGTNGKIERIRNEINEKADA